MQPLSLCTNTRSWRLVLQGAFSRHTKVIRSRAASTGVPNAASSHAASSHAGSFYVRTTKKPNRGMVRSLSWRDYRKARPECRRLTTAALTLACPRSPKLSLLQTSHTDTALWCRWWFEGDQCCATIGWTSWHASRCQ